jgi:PAS domain S-box-containing protein
MNIIPENFVKPDFREPTILIIDDDPTNLGIITEYLEGCNFIILVAEDGESGLARAEYVRPDLILLDVLMPGVDGFEICRCLKVKETTKDIPVIFMTALAETEHKVKGLQLGAVDYITKPFQHEEVLARVTTHLHIRNLTFELQTANETLEKRVEERTAELAQANKELRAEIAERKRIEEVLRRERDLVSRITATSPAGIAVVNRKGQFTFANAQAEQVLGLTREESTQPTYNPPEWRLTNNDDHPVLDETLPLRQVIDAGQPVYDMQHVIEWPDGRRVFLSINAAPLFNELGQVDGIVATVEDVTARIQAEAEREALIAELEAKNAELERFTYTVSHDLKSPLVTIKGFLGFLETDAAMGDVERVKADISRISNATNKMYQLLEELLELARIGHLINPPEEVPLAELAREVVNMIVGQQEKRGVEVEIAPDLPVLYGDRIRLREVLQNLVDNAVKCMGNQLHPRVEIGMRRDNGERVFYVQDNGIGIAPQYHKKVFGLFEKLDPKTEGAGVGLTIVKRIVEVHGGHVWIESEGAGQGSTFCFTLGHEPIRG